MIKLTESKNVYPPAEDSFLLLKTVKYAKGNVLDMFAGSGIIGLSAAKRAKKVTLVDINDDAIAAIKRNAAVNKIKNYEAIKSYLFKELQGKKFDVVYMNPPYLPGDLKNADYLDIATLGGKHGYELTLKAVNDLKDHLKPNGVAFVILSTIYGVNKVYKLLDSINLKFKVISTKKFFFEELILIKISYEKRRSGDGKRADSGSSSDRVLSARA